MLPLVHPICPVLAREVPRGDGWCYELKLDGFRGMLYAGRGAAELRSKTRRPMARFAELARSAAAALGAREAILDGEIVVVSDGLPRFDALLFGRGVPLFAAFDLLWLDGRDLRALRYAERKAALRRLLYRRRGIAFVDTYRRPALFEAAARLDLEGIVAKRRDDPYSPQTRWVKVKNPGYSQNVGRWELFRRRGTSAGRDTDLGAGASRTSAPAPRSASAGVSTCPAPPAPPDRSVSSYLGPSGASRLRSRK